MKCQIALIGLFSLLSFSSAISYCYKYGPRGGYVIDPEGEPPVEDKNCHEVLAELEAKNEDEPVLGRETPRCLENGHFDFYQCQGSQCFCTDCAGLKIEGYENFGRHEVDSSKCKCAREEHEFGRSGMVGAHFRCSSNGGHFKHYQCQGTGCYCTDVHGEALPTDNLEAHFLIWEAEGKDEYCEELATSS